MARTQENNPFLMRTKLGYLLKPITPWICRGNCATWLSFRVTELSPNDSFQLTWKSGINLVRMRHDDTILYYTFPKLNKIDENFLLFFTVFLF